MHSSLTLQLVFIHEHLEFFSFFSKWNTYPKGATETEPGAISMWVLAGKSSVNWSRVWSTHLCCEHTTIFFSVSLIWTISSHIHWMAAHPSAGWYKRKKRKIQKNEQFCWITTTTTKKGSVRAEVKTISEVKTTVRLYIERSRDDGVFQPVCLDAWINLSFVYIRWTVRCGCGSSYLYGLFRIGICSIRSDEVPFPLPTDVFLERKFYN